MTNKYIFKELNRNFFSLWNQYEIKNILGKDIDYIIPKSFYVKQIEKYIYDGKILLEDKNILNTKGGQILEKIANDILE